MPPLALQGPLSCSLLYSFLLISVSVLLVLIKINFLLYNKIFSKLQKTKFVDKFKFNVEWFTLTRALVTCGHLSNVQ